LHSGSFLRDAAVERFAQIGTMFSKNSDLQLYIRESGWYLLLNVNDFEVD
jgi:hypothetical protein